MSAAELALAVRVAREAGALLRAGADRALRVDHKGAIDLVTEVDLAAEALVREAFARETPEIPVHGEEGGGAPDAATRWVVDPVDGTTNLVHGFPWFAVSIGLEVDGRPEAGVVYDPTRDLVFQARRGHGAFAGDQRLAVSTCDRLDAALLGSGFPYDRRERASFYLARFQAFLERTQGVRRAGAASLDLAMVAAGRLDGFWEYGLKAWDVAAARVLITEAGGRVTAHDGGPLQRELPSPLASNGRLHDAMVAVLAEVDAR